MEQWVEQREEMEVGNIMVLLNPFRHQDGARSTNPEDQVAGSISKGPMLMVMPMT